MGDKVYWRDEGGLPMRVKFWWPEDQRFYVGYLGQCHDESMTANVIVIGSPTFWIVPYRLIRVLNN